MRTTLLNSGRGVFQIKKISDFLLTALLFSLIILVLGYFFHIGAGLAAEMLMDVGTPNLENQSL